MFDYWMVRIIRVITVVTELKENVWVSLLCLLYTLSTENCVTWYFDCITGSHVVHFYKDQWDIIVVSNNSCTLHNGRCMMVI